MMMRLDDVIMISMADRHPTNVIDSEWINTIINHYLIKHC